MSTATKTAPAKPPVLDAKGKTLELRVKVIYDEVKEGNKTTSKGEGHVMGLEYQRQRVVIQPADGSKPVVRPAAAVRLDLNKSGKAQRVEKAVRAARAAKKVNA